MPVLRDRFLGRGMKELPGEPFAVFISADINVGEMQLHDDGDEVTISIGELFRTHFGCYDPGVAPEAQVSGIVEAIVDYVDSVLTDRIEFPVPFPLGSSRRGQGRVECRTYVWSGPVDGGVT